MAQRALFAAQHVYSGVIAISEFTGSDTGASEFSGNSIYVMSMCRNVGRYISGLKYARHENIKAEVLIVQNFKILCYCFLEMISVDKAIIFDQLNRQNASACAQTIEPFPTVRPPFTQDIETPSLNGSSNLAQSHSLVIPYAKINETPDGHDDVGWFAS